MFERGTDGPTSILVGIDGTETSLHAGAYAAGLARRQVAHDLRVDAIVVGACMQSGHRLVGSLAGRLVRDAAWARHGRPVTDPIRHDVKEP